MNKIQPTTQLHLSESRAALHAKCPRCRQGDMFATPMYGFKLQKMHRECPHCGMKFEKEPGYFYVAMFISYAMNVAEMIAAGVLTYLIAGDREGQDVFVTLALYLGVLFPVVIFLSPFNYRYSRVALLYWLTPGLRYDPSRTKKEG
jgi:uncharacterized protein (DUF983 family)